MDRYKIVISDCHLSAGKSFEGQLNPHEDFHFDLEMEEMFEYFSAGKYGNTAQGPTEVELVIAGDYFDFLNVPVRGEFEEAVTEEIALYKTEAIIAAHPRVMRALQRFASLPGKRITYLIGNHDADLFFPRVRERITREWDPRGEFPSASVKVLGDVDRLTYPEGFEIRHGNQLEAGSQLNFDQPLLTEYLEKPVLNLPWSSIYVLKIINRMKQEREWIDKVRPVKVFLLFGLVIDPWFTLRFMFLSGFYFVKTRFGGRRKKQNRLKSTVDILKQETDLFLDLEREARQILNERTDLQTIIFGHTHRPMNKIYPDGKQYINTGTWTKMINLDWGRLGQRLALTFAWVRIRDGKAECELRHWQGVHHPHRIFNG